MYLCYEEWTRAQESADKMSSKSVSVIKITYMHIMIACLILDGQKIAKTLEGQIHSETLKIKSLIHQYKFCHLAF